MKIEYLKNNKLPEKNKPVSNYIINQINPDNNEIINTFFVKQILFKNFKCLMYL